jgi:hypothetical protein
MHPTVLHEDSRLVSGDFPAFARERIKDRFGRELVVAYHTGPEGDQSPRYDVRGQTFAEAERLGQRLGDSVIAALDGIPDNAFDRNPVLGSALRAIRLERRALPSVAEAKSNLDRCRAEFERLKREGALHGPVRTAECSVFGAEESLFLASCQESGRLAEFMKAYETCLVQTLRIGNGFIAGWPGEIFVEYGLELKRRAKPENVFVACLVNGDLQGYIVTRNAALEGGYEATNAMFAPETGDRFIEASLDTVRELKQMKHRA